MYQPTGSRTVNLPSVGQILAENAVVFVIQFAAGKIGDALLTNGGIGPVWPASGIALAAMLLWGYSVWPGVAAGAFLLAFLSPLPHGAALLYAAGTTLAAAVGTFLLRTVKFNSSLSRLRDALGLIVLGACVSSIVSASIGASILFANLRSWSGLGSAWLVYWLGDSTGVLLLTPIVLTFPNILRGRDRSRLAELVALLMLLLVGGLAVLGDLPLVPGKLHILTFAVLPLIMWAAIRLGVGATALSIFVVGSVATIETGFGSGPFTINTPLTNAVLLDIFFGVISITGLVLAAVVADRENVERERERLVRERAESEARLRFAAIIESSEDAIISGTLDGIIISWNGGAQHIYGYTEAEAVGKPIAILLPPERMDEENKILETLRAGGSIKHFETIRLTKTGRKISVSLSISPIRDSGGTTVGISGIARDITERKLAEETLRESEEKFRSVFRNAGVGMVIVSPEGRFLAANRSFCNCLGYTEEELRARTVESVTCSEDWPAFSQRLREALLDEHGLQPIQKRCLHKSGRIVYTESSAFLVRNNNGEPQYLVGEVLDITQRKLAEEALSSVNRKLIEAHEEERTWVARELHDDVNQRLALLAVNLDTLNLALPASAREAKLHAADIKHQINELGMDVQALSHRLHSSKLEYLGLSAAAGAFCREFSERKGVNIDFRSENIPKSLPEEISLCLFRVLQEALQNAAKHSGSKNYQVSMSFDSDELHLTVSDSGSGFKLEEALQNPGLGITSMRERLKIVRGDLQIACQEGHGTVVSAKVPLHIKPAAMHAANS